MEFELLLIGIVYVAVIVMVVIWIRLVKAEQNRSKSMIKEQKEKNESKNISNWSAENVTPKRLRSFSCKETVTASECSSRVTYCSSLTSNLKPNDENLHFNEMCHLTRRYWAHELIFLSITNLFLSHEKIAERRQEMNFYTFKSRWAGKQII